MFINYFGYDVSETNPRIHLYRAFYYQTGKPAGDVGVTETTRNQISKQGQKCRNCELCCTETEKKNKQQQKSNTLMEQKTFYRNVILQKMFKITTRSRKVRLDRSAVWNSLRYGISKICSFHEGKHHGRNIPERK